MTKIDVVSGFLGAGKTTLIKKLLKEALDGSRTVLIENEFGEIGIDGGFLKESGIEIKEMNSGCICCSLVGDFGASLKEVINTYAPERILIEPSGVGKLSDVLKAVEGVAGDLDVQINSAVAVVDASKCKMYLKNFGEFFINQIAYAGTVILSRTDKLTPERTAECAELIRRHNEQAAIITTPLARLDGKAVLAAIEGADRVEDLLREMMEEPEHEHHHHEEGECCGHHHHEEECHGHHHEEEECCGHHHEEGECCGHHHEEGECCGHHHEEGECHGHHHEEGECHGHHHEEGECCGHHHGEDHGHHHEEGHGHHHHADEVFSSWGAETPNVYGREELERILEALDGGSYGTILRAKGMVSGEDGGWLYYDYVPQEHEIRSGSPQVTGKICVIGANLDEAGLGKLFRV